LPNTPNTNGELGGGEEHGEGEAVPTVSETNVYITAC